MIRQAVIYTTRYQEMIRFYLELFQPLVTTHAYARQFQLDFPLNQLVIQEELTIDDPYYHFAFLIAPATFQEMKSYIESKHIVLNTFQGETQVLFDYGAKSFYFEDPSGNIIEFICQNFLKEPDTTDLLSKIYGLSEMSFTTNSVEETLIRFEEIGLLDREKNVDQELTLNGLNFIGDQWSYLLVGPVGRTWFFSDKIAKVVPQKIITDHYELVMEKNGEFTCIER